MNIIIAHHRHIYRLKGTELLISIDEQYLRDIRQNAVEHQSLENVPSHQTVKGIAFKPLNEHLYQLQNNGNEIQVPINCLEFDTGNFRLSA